MKKMQCISCKKLPLSKDEIGINKKLLYTKNKNFYCLECLADVLGCTTDDLKDKIADFKEAGCVLF